MNQQEINLLNMIIAFGGPSRNRGNIIGFYPSDEFLIELTSTYNLEIASVFTLGINTHYLWVGTEDSIMVPIITDVNFEILIKHTHPNGTPRPSVYDIKWLEAAQVIGSPQKSSYILPMGQDRVIFNIHTSTI